MDPSGATASASGGEHGTDGADNADATDNADGADADDLSPPESVRRLLTALRTDEDHRPYRRRLATCDEASLGRIRADHGGALAFWANCYNAGTQLLLDERPALYESPLRTIRFFRAPCLTVAGTPLRLDAIEHRILRGGRSKYGLGYLPSPLATSFELRYSLTDLDPRVHFALNCGARSCPPIRAYEADRIDEQLDLATRSYLQGSVEYDPEDGVAELPRLFVWYRGDFGGRAGIRTLLQEYEEIPADARPRFTYRSWDWTRQPSKFVADGEGD